MTNTKNYIFYWKKILNRLKQEADSRLKQYGITYAQFGIIAYMIDNRDITVTQKMIEQFYELSHVTVIGILKRLEKNGFLRCVVNPDDKRSRIVILEDKGVEIFNTIGFSQESIRKRIREVIGDSKCDMLDEITKEIYDNFNEIFLYDYLNDEEEM